MSIFTNVTKHAASVSNLVKHGSTTITSFLLLQTGDYLLLQTTDKILLESVSPSGSGWINQTKS